ncbi:hypothetical protein NFI96_005926 [Prochilodus magdalenae]|nr:hypothetical protein NFI96_005926 [Prochilodus magdalenae]
MKTKEHTRQVRDTVVEKFKARFGYKTISQALNISRSTVQAIILSIRPLQIYQDPAKRPMITLDELQRSTAEASNQRKRTAVLQALPWYLRENLSKFLKMCKHRNDIFSRAITSEPPEQLEAPEHELYCGSPALFLQFITRYDNNLYNDQRLALLSSLHWLPFVARIRFKTLLLAYKAKNGPAPPYLMAMVKS